MCECGVNRECVAVAVRARCALWIVARHRARAHANSPGEDGRIPRTGNSPQSEKKLASRTSSVPSHLSQKRSRESGAFPSKTPTRCAAFANLLPLASRTPIWVWLRHVSAHIRATRRMLCSPTLSPVSTHSLPYRPALFALPLPCPAADDHAPTQPPTVAAAPPCVHVVRLRVGAAGSAVAAVTTVAAAGVATWTVCSPAALRPWRHPRQLPARWPPPLRRGQARPSSFRRGRKRHAPRSPALSWSPPPPRSPHRRPPAA